MASRSQPGRRAGRGALQGDPAGLRHALGPGEAQGSTTPAGASAASERGGFPAGGGGASPAAASPRTSGTSSPPSSGGGRQQGPREQRGRDLETEVRLSFDQAVHGTQIAVSVPTTGPCPTCDGSGAKPGTVPSNLPALRGLAGSTPRARGSSRSHQPCPECGGSGHRDRRSLPHLRRPGDHPGDQALPGEHPGRGPRRQQDQARRQGRGRATAAVLAAIST